MARLTDWLEATAARLPQKTAFLDGKRSITYVALREEARRMAAGLIAHGVAGKPVCIFLPKSVDAVVSILALTYIGSACVPLDVQTPSPRLAKIRHDICPAAVITHKAPGAWAEGLPLLEVSELAAFPSREGQVDAATAGVGADSVWGVLYTSGSTGTPKGVIISHRQVLDNRWFCDCGACLESSIMGNAAPLHFALSTVELFAVIHAGASMHLLPKQLFGFPARLLQELAERRINTILWAPALLSLVAGSGILAEDAASHTLPPLQQICSCGGPLPLQTFADWRRAFPQAAILNVYGMTETASFHLHHFAVPGRHYTAPLPLGSPCAGKRVIVRADGRPATAGEEGELYLSIPGSTYGYQGDAAQTAERFVRDETGSVWLRTGDIVRQNARGEYLYVSRRDFLVKHMGQRVELGEVESVARCFVGVRDACCLYDAQKDQLLLVYAGDAGTSAVRRWLQAELPRYMQPRRFYQSAELPLNAHGKIDRPYLLAKYVEQRQE